MQPSMGMPAEEIPSDGRESCMCTVLVVSW